MFMMASAPGNAAAMLASLISGRVAPWEPNKRMDSGRSLRICTKTGCLSRLPPKNIRLPIFFSSKWCAKSLCVKGAVGLTRIMKPNHEQSVRQPVESHS